MSGDIEWRRREIRDFARRASWQCLPGVSSWQRFDSDHLTADAQRDLGAVVASHVPVHLAAEFVEAVDAHVVDFHLWTRHHRTPQGDAVRAWCREAVTRLEELRSWLERDPLPNAVEPDPSGFADSVLTCERVQLLRAIEGPLGFAHSHVEPRRQGRPFDHLRHDLAGAVGASLNCIGVAVTIYASGVFARALEVVFADVGLRSDDDAGKSLVRVMRDIKRAHPEW